MAPEQIPLAAGSTAPWYKRVPIWGWGLGGGLALGLGWWIIHKRSTAAASSTSSSTSSEDCTCDDGSTPTNGVCDDGSQPACSGNIGYLVGGGGSDNASILEALDQLQNPPKSTTSSSSSTGTLKEGARYGSGYYLRGSATPSGYTYLTDQDLRDLEKKGANIPFFFAKTSNAKTLTQMGTANLLPGTPVYAQASDLTSALKAASSSSSKSTVNPGGTMKTTTHKLSPTKPKTTTTHKTTTPKKTTTTHRAAAKPKAQPIRKPTTAKLKTPARPKARTTTRKKAA